MDEQNRRLVEEFLDATQRGDVASMERLAHDDVVMFWPQSGERFTGRDNAIGAMLAQEDRPKPTGESRLVGSGDVWVYTVPLTYSDGGTYHYVGVIELEQGKVKRGTGYFAAPFEPQEYRTQFADAADRAEVDPAAEADADLATTAKGWRSGAEGDDERSAGEVARGAERAAEQPGLGREGS